MTPYRKNIINAYCSVITAEYLLLQVAISMHLHFEIGELNKYLEEGYEFSRDTFKDSDDPVVIKIRDYLDELNEFISELEERNQLSPEDIEYGDVDDVEESEEKKEAKVNNLAGMAIFMLTIRICVRIVRAIKALCEIKNETPALDFRQPHQYNDDNIQSLAIFYIKLCDFIHYLEKETNGIAGKRNW